MAAPRLLHQGLGPPSADTGKKNSLQISCEAEEDERQSSPSGLSNIYTARPLEVCQRLWAVSSGLHSAEETDPSGAGTALGGRGINFILKMLLLEFNIYKA